MLRDRLPGLATAAAVIFSAAAAAATPPAEISVSDWAQAKRYVATSSQPGPWRNENTPFAVEVMECLTPSHPARRVTAMVAAQMMKTEVALNWMGFVGDIHPRPMLYVLPSTEDYRDWNREQWQPNYDAQDGDNIFAKRYEPPSKSGQGGQTEKFKPFAGGRLMITGATSSKGLQRRSVCYLIMDEISEYPADADGRGDPVRQARARQDAWGEEAKELAISTPKTLPDCRISKAYEEGDQRRFFVPCPECRTFHVLRIENLDEEDGQAVFNCPACGVGITETQKAPMIRAGVYIKTYPDEENNPAPPKLIAEGDIAKWRERTSGGREPSFHCWQAYSLFKSWNILLSEWKEAQRNPGTLKTFSQQKLAEAWDESGEAPDYERLFERRQEALTRETVPHGFYVLTCGVDVQGDRLEWSVWAWGPAMTSALVDAGVIMGDPNELKVWRELAEVREKKYRGENGFQFEIDLMAVDTGYLSERVYRFVAGRPNTLGIDGRGDPLMPPLGTPTKKKAAGGKLAALIYPVGTHGLKSRLYHALRLTLDGPDDDGVWPNGCVHLPEWISRDFVMQMTAETLMEREMKSSGAVKREWVKIKDRANEALDCWVYAASTAWWLGVDGWNAEQWNKVIAQRGGGPEKTLETFSLGLEAGSGERRSPDETEPPRKMEDETGGSDWIEPRKDWLS